jgi:hypothetical protein
MHQRRKAREVTLQVLYELDVLRIDVREAIDRFGRISMHWRGQKIFLF